MLAFNPFLAWRGMKILRNVAKLLKVKWLTGMWQEYIKRRLCTIDIHAIN